MKTFEEIISSGHLNLRELEEFRQERLYIEKMKLRKAMILFGVVSALSVVLFIFLKAYPLIIIELIVGPVWLLIWWNNVKKVYIQEIKERLVKTLINSIDESFGYQPHSFIPKEVFKNANFVKNFNRYKGEDYFFGKLDDIPIEFSELNVQQKNDKSTHTLFNGIFIKVGFKHIFKGRTAIVPDTLERNFGSFGRFFQNLNFSRDQLIKFDNQEFEKLFAIYSNNEAETKNLISGEMLNYLIQLADESPRGVFFSFSEDKFHLGLFNRQDLFRVNIDTPINETTVASYYSEITYILNVVLTCYSYLEEKSLGTNL